MVRFLAGKGVQYALVLLFAVTLNFMLPRMMPGSPLVFLAGEDVGFLSEAQRTELLRSLGLDQPLWRQYVRYLGNLVTGNLGYSFQKGRPISEIIAERLPWTLLLVGLALLAATLIGVVWGTLVAWRRGSAFDLGSLGISMFFESTPSFWLGMIFIAVFAARLRWFPIFGAQTPGVSLAGWAMVANAAWHLALPLATLTPITIPGNFLIMRYSMLTVLGEQYIATAKAKGLAERTVIYRHAMRNALLPMATVVMLNLGFIASGATVIETVFSYPGAGPPPFSAGGPTARPGRAPPRRRRLGVVGVVGLALLILLVGSAIFAPWIAPYNPEESSGNPFAAPSRLHPLGTNDIGQDILSEFIYGTRISLAIGFLAAIVAISIGTLIGTVAGYFGGWVDAVLMRAVDVVLVIPFLPLMILIAAYVGPSFWNIILVIGLLVWARPARVLRSQVLSLKSLDYIDAARALGAPPSRTLRLHVLPGVLSLSLAQFILAASNAILIEASLSFLGLGDPTAKSWGSILYYAQVRSAFLSGAWLWWVLPPGLLITLAVLGFAFTGFALEEVLNPRLRGMS